MTKEFEKLWDFFGDHIRCINLTSRKDRYHNSKKIFNKYNIPVNYYKAKKHRDGRKGCFESHINVIREAYYSGAERVLIFGDDIKPTDYLTTNHLKKAINFMKKDKDWEIFYLGVMPNVTFHSSSRTNYSGIYKTKGICAHAYVVNRKAMKKLINIKYKGTPIDYYYINNFGKKSYALYPTMFNQGLSHSDISDSNWWESYATDGTMENVYGCVEAYAYYVNYPLSVLVPLLIIVLAWIVTGMYNRYHVYCLFALVISLLLFGTFTQL